MLRPRRFPRKTAAVLAVLAGLLLVPHAGTAAASTHGGGRPGTVRTVAAVSPAASGGLCSVPGIGDIGGLLGFCSLGTSGLTGDLNNICQPSLPDPEPANSGINSLVRPPATPGQQVATPYNEYGVAGQYWSATNLQCSDMTSLIGNNVSGMAFDIAKSIDRVTISIYQAAAGNGIVSWLSGVTDKLISGLGNAIYFPYLAIVIIIAAIWLAWQGLIRKRGTATIEGTVWMVLACVAAILLIGRPADFTGLGTGVSNGISQALNAAFAKLPSPGQASCLPVRPGDPQIKPASYSYTSGGTVVGQNANELWTVLVCKPWLDGEFGTTVYAAPGGKPTVVNRYGRQLLWAQAIALNEKPTSALISAKQATYAGIASSLEHRDPAVYPLFQGKQWTTRLEVGFAALLASLLAGVLVLLISVTLILLKLSFLLLLIVGPFFLLIGTHPGFGRVVAIRWVEMLVGVLLKQAAVALVLSVLLYCYALIMGTSDAVLPWALKIMMIALVTVAAVIYRRPFTHLFSAVGYGMIGSRERAEADLSRAGAAARGNTLAAATVTVPGVAAYRAARWARRNPAQAAGLALGAATAARAGAAAAAGLGTDSTGGTGSGEEMAGEQADGTAAGAAADTGQQGGRASLAARARGRGAASGETSPADSAGREAPPLHLPARQAAAAQDRARGASGTPGRVAGTGTGGSGDRGTSGADTARAAGTASGPGPARPARIAAPPRTTAGGVSASAGGPARTGDPASGADVTGTGGMAGAGRTGGSASGPLGGPARLPRVGTGRPRPMAVRRRPVSRRPVSKRTAWFCRAAGPAAHKRGPGRAATPGW